MARMCVFVTENLKGSLRGEITKWMLEVKSGVFIGSLSARVRNKLWGKICAELGKGRALMIEPEQNEQHFHISSVGEPNYIPKTYEGLQLIQIPYSQISQKDEKKEKTGKTLKNPNKTIINPTLNWSYPQGFPENFIARSMICDLTTTNMKVEYAAESSYYEISPSTLWDMDWHSEVLRCISYIHHYLSENEKIMIGGELMGKKIACLDIETTDYIPRAKEGYVNIIGLATLDLRNESPEYRKLIMFQAFNMLRKKDRAPELLKLSSPFLADCEVLIVFNKGFDLPILTKIAKNYTVPFSLPSKIIDIQEDLISVKKLEQFMSTAGYQLREKSEKGKYSEYYAKFKGDSKGKGKQIEPIGVYNLMDVITVLLYALQFKS